MVSFDENEKIAAVEHLERLVFDENKIVTSKMLCQSLKVDVNLAKQYMHEFYKVKKSKESVVLHAHYFIVGNVFKEGQKCVKVLVVSETNLEEVKQQFQEITSCHIYSLSKKQKLDECLLYNTENMYLKEQANNNEKGTSNFTKYAAIKHPNVVLKSPVLKKLNGSIVESKSNIPTKQVTSSAVSNGNSPASAAVGVANTKNECAQDRKDAESNISNGKGSKIKNEKQQKTNSLASMWQKSEEKTKTNKTEESKTDVKGKNKSPQVTKNASKNSIMNMFSKQAEKKSTNTSKKPADSPVPDRESSPSPEKAKVQHDSPVKKAKVQHDSPVKKEAMSKASSKPASKKRKSSQKSTKQSSKKQKDGDSDEDFTSQKKKHRRICVFDDSDSESETEEAKDRIQRSLFDSEDPIPKAVESSVQMDDSDENPIPPMPPVLLQKGKKRVWKTISKTYKDEEGYLITKQEKELVSASDDEEDPLPKSEAPKEMPKNTSTNKKQSSLTSFFKFK